MENLSKYQKHNEPNESVNAENQAQAQPQPVIESKPEPEQPDARDTLIETLQGQIDDLRGELATSNATIQAQKSMGIRNGEYVPSAGTREMQRQRAIQAMGGQFRWNSLPASERVKILGFDDSGVSDDLLKKYFGKGSDAAAANGLAKRSPNEYARLRCIALERKVL